MCAMPGSIWAIYWVSLAPCVRCFDTLPEEELTMNRSILSGTFRLFAFPLIPAAL